MKILRNAARMLVRLGELFAGPRGPRVLTYRQTPGMHKRHSVWVDNNGRIGGRRSAHFK